MGRMTKAFIVVLNGNIRLIIITIIISFYFMEMILDDEIIISTILLY